MLSTVGTGMNLIYSVLLPRDRMKKCWKGLRGRLVRVLYVSPWTVTFVARAQSDKFFHHPRVGHRLDMFWRWTRDGRTKVPYLACLVPNHPITHSEAKARTSFYNGATFVPGVLPPAGCCCISFILFTSWRTIRTLYLPFWYPLD